MERALGAYSHLADDWSDRMVGQIQSRFDAHANSYRALVERLAVPHKLSGEQEQAILRSLNSLRREHAKEPAQAAS